MPARGPIRTTLNASYRYLRIKGEERFAGRALVFGPGHYLIASDGDAMIRQTGVRRCAQAASEPRGYSQTKEAARLRQQGRHRSSTESITSSTSRRVHNVACG